MSAFPPKRTLAVLEPTALVLLELLCWAGVMALVGLAISLAFGREPRLSE